MNQMTAPESEQNKAISSSVIAGQRLREAREGLGLTRDNVAQELRLQEKLIAALEEGDHSQLPPTAFISGYLRAYARLLSIPAEQLISDYLSEQVAPSTYRATDRSGMPKISSRDPKFRYTSYVIFAGLVLLFGAWWASQYLTIDSLLPIQSSATNDEQQEIEASLPGPMPLYQDPPDEEPTAVDQSQAMPQSTLPTPGNAPASGTAAPAETVAPALVITAPATMAAEAEKSPPAPVVEPEPEPLTPSTPQSLLVLEYQAESWTKVVDADGRVLALELVSPGRKLELRGVAPFKVFLGYAPGVLVYHKGTLFSHAPYQRGDLARFRVGSSQDNQAITR